ncbi:MAG: RNA repair domain-containing protein [Candidatus Bathyarchaeia archaeon]
MKGHPLRALMNRLKWTEEDLSRFTIRYIHRGAPGDTREVDLSMVAKIGKGWFEIRGEEGSPIPFHRVLEVADSSTGMILWRRGGR